MRSAQMGDDGRIYDSEGNLSGKAYTRSNRPTAKRQEVFPRKVSRLLGLSQAPATKGTLRNIAELKASSVQGWSIIDKPTGNPNSELYYGRVVFSNDNPNVYIISSRVAAEGNVMLMQVNDDLTCTWIQIALADFFAKYYVADITAERLFWNTVRPMNPIFENETQINYNRATGQTSRGLLAMAQELIVYNGLYPRESRDLGKWASKRDVYKVSVTTAISFTLEAIVSISAAYDTLYAGIREYEATKTVATESLANLVALSEYMDRAWDSNNPQDIMRLAQERENFIRRWQLWIALLFRADLWNMCTSVTQMTHVYTNFDILYNDSANLAQYITQLKANNDPQVAPVYDYAMDQLNNFVTSWPKTGSALMGFLTKTLDYAGLDRGFLDLASMFLYITLEENQKTIDEMRNIIQSSSSGQLSGLGTNGGGHEPPHDIPKEPPHDIPPGEPPKEAGADPIPDDALIDPLKYVEPAEYRDYVAQVSPIIQALVQKKIQEAKKSGGSAAEKEARFEMLKIMDSLIKLIDKATKHTRLVIDKLASTGKLSELVDPEMQLKLKEKYQTEIDEIDKNVSLSDTEKDIEKALRVSASNLIISANAGKLSHIKATVERLNLRAQSLRNASTGGRIDEGASIAELWKMFLGSVSEYKLDLGGQARFSDMDAATQMASISYSISVPPAVLGDAIRQFFIARYGQDAAEVKMRSAGDITIPPVVDTMVMVAKAEIEKKRVKIIPGPTGTYEEPNADVRKEIQRDIDILNYLIASVDISRQGAFVNTIIDAQGDLKTFLDRISLVSSKERLAREDLARLRSETKKWMDMSFNLDVTTNDKIRSALKTEIDRFRQSFWLKTIVPGAGAEEEITWLEWLFFNAIPATRSALQAAAFKSATSNELIEDEDFHSKRDLIRTYIDELSDLVVGRYRKEDIEAVKSGKKEAKAGEPQIPGETKINGVAQLRSKLAGRYWSAAIPNAVFVLLKFFFAWPIIASSWIRDKYMAEEWRKTRAIWTIITGLSGTLFWWVYVSIKLDIPSLVPWAQSINKLQQLVSGRHIAPIDPNQASAGARNIYDEVAKKEEESQPLSLLQLAGIGLAIGILASPRESLKMATGAVRWAGQFVRDIFVKKKGPGRPGARGRPAQAFKLPGAGRPPADVAKAAQDFNEAQRKGDAAGARAAATRLKKAGIKVPGF